MNNNPDIFDRVRVAHNHVRAQKTLPDCGFIIDRTAQDLADRLLDVNRSFPLAVQIGSRAVVESVKIGTLIQTDTCFPQQIPPPLSSPLKKGGGLEGGKNVHIQCSSETLPFAPQSLDLVISPFDLHSVNDLVGALIQIRQALKPDGLFLASIAGGETLNELRQSLMEAEINITGGASPRVHPFADRHQMGALLQRAGFALPVVDMDKITVTYSSLFSLMHDLRGMGESNALTARHKKPLTRAVLSEAERIYREKFSDPDGRIRATFEIITLTGWSPHESQQKPLPRGCATHSLSDVL